MANTCESLVAMTTDICQPSLGGIKRVWLADYAEDAVSESGISADVITAFKEGVTWLPYTFRKNTGSMTSTANFSDEGGNYVSTELVLSFSKMETAKRLAMNALLLGQAMAIVEDANGKRWFLGKDNPVTATAGAGETGTAKSDANRYTITLTDESLLFPMEVSKDIVLG